MSVMFVCKCSSLTKKQQPTPTVEYNITCWLSFRVLKRIRYLTLICFLSIIHHINDFHNY